MNQKPKNGTSKTLLKVWAIEAGLDSAGGRDGEKQWLLRRLEESYRRAEELLAAGGHTPDAAEIRAIQILAEGNATVGAELPDVPPLSDDQARLLAEVAEKLDALRLELARADLHPAQDAVRMARIRGALAALYAEARVIYQLAGLDRDDAIQLAHALRADSITNR